MTSEVPRGDVLTETGEPRPTLVGDFWAIALIVVVWTGLALAIDPRGDFPLNDDWGYGLPVKGLVERGDIRFTDFANPTLIAQEFWGAMFCLPTGFSYTPLRISTLVVSLFGLIGMYGILRQLGASRLVALFGAGIVGANPLYFNLSYSFMTDVPFVSVTILSIFFLIRGMERDRDGLIWTGLAFGLASMMIRQIGLGVFLGFVLAYPFARGFGRKWIVQAILPAAGAYLLLKLYERGLLATDRLPFVYERFNRAIATTVTDMIHVKPGVLRGTAYRFLAFLMYVGLFTAPFGIVMWPSRLRRLSGRMRVIEIAMIVLGTAFFTVTSYRALGLMPSGGNLLLDFGLGARFSLRGDWPESAPREFAWALTIVAALGGVLGLLALGQLAWQIVTQPVGKPGEMYRPGAVLLVAIGGVNCVLPVLTGLPVFDRYYVPMVPIFVGLLWQGFGGSDKSSIVKESVWVRAPAIAAGLLGFVLLFGFAVAGTHDYLNLNRERWAEAHRLEKEAGLTYRDIDGGWEYNNVFRNEERLYKSHKERELMMTAKEKEGSSFTPENSTYVIGVSPMRGYAVVRKVPLSPLLPLAPGELYVLKKSGVGGGKL